MRKIFIFLILMSSIVFGAKEEKYGFKSYKINDSETSIVINLVGIKGELYPLEVVKIFNFGEKSVEEAAMTFASIAEKIDDFFENWSSNDASREYIIGEKGDNLFYLERKNGTVKYIKLFRLIGKDNPGIKYMENHNSNVLEYSILNNYISEEISRKILEYSNK